MISIYSGKARDPEGCNDRQDSARVVIKRALDLFFPSPFLSAILLHIVYTLFLCDFSLSHAPITARDADSRPLFDHKFRIGVNANVQGIVQLSVQRAKTDPLPPSPVLLLFHVPLMQCLFLSRRGGESSLFFFWLYHTPPKFIPPSRGSAQPPPPSLLSFSATHMLAMQKNLPPPPPSLPPFSRATEVRGIISRIKADSARYQATPQATGCGILRARIALNLSLVR